MSNIDDDTTDDIDALFGSIGLNNAPVSREELFINEELTTLKVDTLRYWLRQEMDRYRVMKKKGIIPCKVILAPGSKIPTYKPVTVLEYGAEAIDYYLCMKHLPWFQDMHNRKALDRPKMVKHILDIERVKKVIEDGA